jgi:hypothetical protein
MGEGNACGEIIYGMGIKKDTAVKPIALRMKSMALFGDVPKVPGLFMPRSDLM